MFQPRLTTGWYLGEALRSVPFCPHGTLLRVYASAGEVSSLTTNLAAQSLMGEAPFFPQTMWPHWRVLTVGVRACWLIDIVSGAFGIFLVNFRTEWLLWRLWHVHVHFDCAGSQQNGWRGICVRHFPVNFHIKWRLLHVHVHFDCAGSLCVRHFSCKFPHKMALVTCPCEFRLRRLALCLWWL